MRLLAAGTIVASCLAVSAQAQPIDAGAAGVDAIGLMIDDPIGLLLEDPIELLLRSQDYLHMLPPARGKEIGFSLAALESDLSAINTGSPVTPPVTRRVRSGRLGHAELAARAYEPNYAKAWPSASLQPTPNVEPPPRIVMDGDITLRVDFQTGQR